MRNVYAYKLLQVGSDALVKGDIYYNSIEMEVGAKIDGRLVVCSTDEELDLHKIDIESKENSTTIIPEFDFWEWAPSKKPLEMVIEFKKDVYNVFYFIVR